LVGQAPAWALEAVDRSLLTLRGLQDRDSGLLVASPTTSIPQWPASPRGWDYRYAWLRDCADAGIALAHAGAGPEAERVGLGLAELLGNQTGLAAPVHRLSGRELPPEHTLEHLRGYSSAAVRVGNGAGGQLQLDTLGEVLRLAAELERTSHCPKSLRSLVPSMARVTTRDWRLPDHGIWEVRGKPQQYVHSKVMSWAALRRALELEGRGADSRMVGEWCRAADEIRVEIDRHGRGSEGELVMSFQDPSADSSLLAAYLVGFLDPAEPRAGATLDRILGELGRGPIAMRHTPERDGIPAPCFPFIFPGLWAAVAEAGLGRTAEAAARFLAIWELAGPAGQLSEVADPEAGELWGNYPQVQSHAALVEAALAIWAPRWPERN
jgi:GH15 family glucan-1,4-alpha-glucosidase